MSHPFPHDDRWAELVSLLAAGCLTPDEQREVRQHLEICENCRERFRQLIAVCDALAAVRPVFCEGVPRIGEHVMSSLAAVGPRQSVRRAGWKWGLAAGIAASLVGAVTIGTFFRPHSAHQSSTATLPAVIAAGLKTDVSSQPPTLITYERSLAESGEAIGALLDREARRLSFLSATDVPANRMKEFLP
jgi:hypothetical protein